MELKGFPSWAWICKLSEKRKYTGSVGTDGQRGCMSIHTLNYSVWKAENEEGEKILRATCRVQPPFNSEEQFEQEEISLPFSEEYSAEVQKWILEQVEKYRSVIGK